MTLSEMRQWLATEDIRLTRSLGQNFLHDGNQVRRIVALAQLPPGAEVLEIGPGLGPLTEELLAAGARVVAVEKDQRLVEVLQRRWPAEPRLTLVHADALDWIRARTDGPVPDHLVANLPYSVGSPILVELASVQLPPVSMTVTLQAEVVDRIRGRAGTPEYGVLTLLLARNYEVKSSFRIPASCFFPAPDVESACVRLERRAAPLVTGVAAETYVRLVKLAFTQRRKQLAKVLRGSWDAGRLREAWKSLGLADDVRAEVLAPEILAALATALSVPSTP